MEFSEAQKCLPRVRRYLFGNVVDLGCGSFPIVPNAVGVDARPGAANFVGDLVEAASKVFQQESLDAVFSSHALEDFSDTHKVLSRWCGPLKHGGYLVLYLPHQDLYPRVGHPLANRDHKVNFEPWDVVKILQDPMFPVGMEVISTSVHGWGDVGSYEDLHAGRIPGKSIQNSEYSFQVIARRRVETMEPHWAQPRLYIPQEHLDVAASNWGEGFRLAVVSDTDCEAQTYLSTQQGLEAISKELGEKVAVVVLQADDLRNVNDVSPKALAATAELVVDLSIGRPGEQWAAAHDVDSVAIDPVSTLKRWPGMGPRTSLVTNDGPVSAMRSASAPWRVALEKAVEIRARGKSGVSLAMIVKNEERDLPRCLTSLGELCDEKIIVDTGSTDATAQIAHDAGCLVYYHPWENSFSDARNKSLSHARRRWTIWMDADDILETPWPEVRDLLNKPGADTYAMNIAYGGSVFQHQRLFLTGKKVRFVSMVHEYPIIDGLASAHSGMTVRHATEPSPVKKRESRNVLLTERQVICGPGVPRHWFYHGNALREAGRLAEAVEAYERYLSIGTWADEMSIAARHLGHCHLDLGDRKKARAAFLRSVEIDGRWAETYFDLGMSSYSQGQLDESIRWFSLAASCKLHDSPLFKQPMYYGPESLRALIKAYLRRSEDGDLRLAKQCATKLLEISADDEMARHVMDIVDGAVGAMACPLCDGQVKAEVNAIGPSHTICQSCKLLIPFKLTMDQLVTDQAACTASVVRRGYEWKAASRALGEEVLNRARVLTGENRLRVLDVMSAAPVLAGRIAELGNDVVVVDACEAVSTCDEAKLLEVKVGLIEELEFPVDWAGTFDFITLIHALQHFTHPSILKKLSDLLKPGGVLFSRHLDHDAPGIEERAKTGKAFWALTNRSTEILAWRSGLEVLGRAVKTYGGEADVWFRKYRLPSGIKPMHVTEGQGPRKPVLLVRPGAIGDVLMGAYAARKLKEEDPARPVHFATQIGALLENNPDVDEILSLEDAERRLGEGLYDDARKLQYPVLEPAGLKTECAPHRHHDYPQNEIPYHLAALFAECAGIDGLHEIKPGSFKIHFTTEEILKARDVLDDLGVHRFMTLQTAAGWSRYKEWYNDQWREVVKHLSDEGEVVVHLGGRGDVPLWQPGDRPDGYISLIDSYPIRISAAIIKLAKMHLGVDSVLTHVAAAVETPQVVLWGSTSAKGSGYSDNENVVAPPEQGCQPCYRETHPGSVHPKGPCPFDHACMKRITVEAVLDAIRCLQERLTEV